MGEVSFLKRCAIFCAGDFDGFVRPGEAFVIAADGGLRCTRALGLTPDLILGDFDSLGYVPGGARVFPEEKDDTDAMLAVREGLRQGCSEFLLYGCLGGSRLDHQIAAFQTLQFLTDRGAVGYLVGSSNLLTVVKNGSLAFPAEAEGIFSVFCMGPDAKGVSISGAKYPVTNATLTSGFPLGVSNRFTGSPARITVREGSLLVLWDRKNGFPQRSEL